MPPVTPSLAPARRSNFVRYPLLELIDRDLGLEPNGVIVALDVAPKLLLDPFRVEFRIIVDGLDELVARDRGIARDNLVCKDEP
jgi:hypothetical protein